MFPGEGATMSETGTAQAVAGSERGPAREAETEVDRGRKYLYAVVAAGEPQRYQGVGIAGKDVYTIAAGRVAALVSDLAEARIRPERRHLAAHQELLKRVLRETTPLPMSFGIVADNPQAVRKILTRNQKAFLDKLARVAGKVEMGLRVTFDVPNIFEYFVATHAELRAARDRFFGTHREPTQEEKIEVGRMFDRLLGEDRQTYTDQVEAILAPVCAEFRANKCRKESEVMNLACLVKRDEQERFEAGVFEAAKLFDNQFAFDYNGPWAPYSFVELNLAA
jgi:hypothetical protein